MQTKNNTRIKDMLLIGELIFDINIYSKLIGTSLETPTIKSFYKNTKIELGGAGKVYKAFLKLKKQCDFISVLGSDKVIKIKDKNYEKIIKYFHKGKSITKTRYWVDNYKLLQINLDNERKINNVKYIQNKILKHLKNNAYKSIIISDYMHGLFDKDFIDKILKIVRQKKTTIYVDQQSSHKKSGLNIYNNIDYLIINENELNLFNKQNITIKQKIKNISKQLNIPNIVIKLGSNGSIAYLDNKFFKTEVFKKINNLSNTSGAGDYFLAKFAASYNKNFKVRLKLSNKFSYDYIIKN